MKIIKLALISVVLLFMVVMAISLFFPSHVRISKAIDINKNKELVHAQISDVNNWKNWYPHADSLPVIVENGKAKGLQISPKQAVTITSITDSSVTASLSNNKVSMGWNILTPADTTVTTVQWYMDVNLNWYPWEKFSSLLLEKRYGPVMEQGLSNLKTYLK